MTGKEMVIRAGVYGILCIPTRQHAEFDCRCKGQDSSVRQDVTRWRARTVLFPLFEGEELDLRPFAVCIDSYKGIDEIL